MTAGTVVLAVLAVIAVWLTRRARPSPIVVSEAWLREHAPDYDGDPP